jgi:hypothetical protein
MKQPFSVNQTAFIGISVAVFNLNIVKSLLSVMIIAFLFSCRTPKSAKKVSRTPLREKKYSMPVPEKRRAYVPPTYRKFIKALKQSDIQTLNSLLNIRCEFKEVPEQKGKYAFFRDNKIIIGPYPLDAYRNSLTLNLTRPAGECLSDYSRFQVFSRNHDLYFRFGRDFVDIEGSSIKGTKENLKFNF